MLLICPVCRSGLEVPDGTTAMVRCPACKTVFSPAAVPAPAEPEAPEESRPKPPRKPSPRPADENAEPPRRKPTPAAKPRGRGEPKPENRDFNPPDPEEEKKRKKRRRDDEKIPPEERAALLAAFGRAAWGCKLIWVSFGLFTLSMVLIIGFYFQTAFPALEPSGGFVVAAGAIGALGWILAAVGVGLCLSGPPSPGHWGYGIAAAIATGLHLMLLLALVAKGTDYSPGKSVDPGGPAAKWGLVPTRLDAVTYYLTVVVYKDQELVPKGEMNFSIIVGIAEVIRSTLLLMLLSCMAQSAGDKELAHKCTRAAGFASFGPGFMALGMLLFAALIAESHAGVTGFTKILFSTIVMGTYAILIGCVFPAFMVAREVADACEEPFQSQLPQM